MSTTRVGSRAAARPDPEAMRLAQDMFDRDDVMAAILDETIPTQDGSKVTESGRTMCGPDREIHGPLARFPSAVELASCPRGVNGGTWHTHVTRSQLKNPSNSLPDTANVIFGDIDVSMVVGTESAEAVVAHENLAEGKQAFRESLGADIDSTDDVIDAIISGAVDDPANTRQRIRRRLSPLFVRQRVNFSDLDHRLEQSGIPAHSMLSFEVIDAKHHAVVANQLKQSSNHSRKNPRNPPRVREFVRETNSDVKSVVDEYDIKGQALGVAISESVQRAFRAFL